MKAFLKRNYHWIIAAVALVQVFIHTGIGNNFASVFIEPVCEGLGVTRAEFSMAYSMKSVAALAVCFFSGTIFNRLGYRASAFWGLCSAAGGYLLFAFSEHFSLAYVACFIIGASNGLCATAGATRIISDWFVRYRGTVLGLVTAASGLGGSLFCILQTTIIERSSWQTALAVSAAILVLLAAAVVLFTRNKPRDLGTVPLGDGEEVVGKRRRIADRAFPGLPVQKLIRRPAFYLMLLCTFLMNWGNYAGLNVVIPHFKDLGFSTAKATALQSILFLMMAGTKFISGFLSDHFGAKRVTLLCAVSGLVTFLLLPFASSFPLALLCMLLLALSLPLNTVMISLLGFTLFGYRGQRQYVGVFLSMIYVANMIVTPVANGIRDVTGSYRNSFFLAAGLAALAIALYPLLFRLAGKDKELETKE